MAGEGAYWLVELSLYLTQMINENLSKKSKCGESLKGLAHMHIAVRKLELFHHLPNFVTMAVYFIGIEIFNTAKTEMHS
jgi:hypothetical protein